MSVSTVHVLHGIYNTVLISQITDANPVTNLEELVAESAGLPYPIFTATMGVKPAVPFSTTQLKTILDTSGVLTSIADLSGANTDLLFKKVQDMGRRVSDATAEHIRLRMSQAYMVLDRITAGHNTPAVATCRLGTTYDGINNPLVPAGSVALTGTPTGDTWWVAGPVVINGVTLPGIQDMSLEFERQVYELGGDGEIYDTFAAARYLSPVLTFRTLTNVWATYGINGTVLTSVASYLRKVTVDGRVAPATAQHIAFTNTTGGLISVQDSTGGGNEPSITTVRCRMVGTAAAEAIAASTASTIP